VREHTIIVLCRRDSWAAVRCFRTGGTFRPGCQEFAATLNGVGKSLNRV
jgi:hypothetical protein